MTVREIRSLIGLTQKEFGERYGIPMRTIQNWEGGQRECPAYVLALLERVVWEDYEEENGHVPEYSIESTDYNATYDLHLDDSDDLEDAKKKAKYWEGKGYPVELVRTKEFLTGFYNKICL